MIIAIDPGSKGGVVLGDSKGSLRIHPNPLTPKDFSNFCKLWEPGSVVAIEKPVTTALRANLVPGQRITTGTISRLKFWDSVATAMLTEIGKWEVALHPWSPANDRGSGSIFWLPPQTWRRLVFGKANLVKGGMAWKGLELELARSEFPHIKQLFEKSPKSDHPIYGLSAACCIWLAANKIRGGEK